MKTVTIIIGALVLILVIVLVRIAYLYATDSPIGFPHRRLSVGFGVVILM